MKLIVTEKDNVAARIAEILSGGKAKREGAAKSKKSSGVPVYSYSDGSGEVRVIGLRGHILKVDFPEGYDNWEKTDLVELVGASLIKVPTIKLVLNALVKQAKDANEVVIATDFDREGELIGVDALNKIREISPDVKIKRARFSSLTEKEINDSFASLEEPYYDMAKAGEARQDIDLIWGATLTRGVSLASTRLGKNFLSVGRVQSPTLVLIAEREKERNAFVPVPYWQITAAFEKDGERFEATHAQDRFLKKAEAETIFAKLDETGRVTKVERRERNAPPPAPFNTTSFLAAASSIGLTAAYAMKIAETLYMSGYISYPRTDNTVYPPSLNLRELVGMFKGTEFDAASAALLAQKELKPTRGKKFATDHPPIYPTGVTTRGAIDERAWKVYELVVRRFFATLALPAQFENMKVAINVNGEEFSAKGERVLLAGWLEFYRYAARKEAVLPDLYEGETLSLIEKQLLDKETQPPPRYGQGTLIQEMEKLGLGTKATRHNIIQNLIDRQYAYGDPVVPTNLGLAMADTLRDYAATISTPRMTAELEKEMDEIAEGRMSREKVVNDSRGVLVDTVKSIETNREEIS
ncbi:MAG: DNA topoisomerase I, partial [Actinomycetota bacterium]